MIIKEMKKSKNRKKKEEKRLVVMKTYINKKSLLLNFKWWKSESNLSLAQKDE